MGPPRPPAGAVQMGPQHRYRFQGQSLYCGGRLRAARAEVQENSMIGKLVGAKLIVAELVVAGGFSGALGSPGFGWGDLTNSGSGRHSEDTRGNHSSTRRRE